jgi:penicillin-binding protein 1C
VVLVKGKRGNIVARPVLINCLRRYLFLLVGIPAGGYILVLLFNLLLPPLPDKFSVACSAQVLDREGRLLRLFTTADGYWRLPTRLDHVDPQFIRLLIACEDKRFWTHHGVDALALGRAMLQLARHGRVVSGASTITMQTVRLLRPRSRTLSGKLYEMAQALRLERRLSKQEILETYLTLAPYGGNIEGLEAACLFYFQKNAARITPSEAALLISLPQSPERRRPDRQHSQAVAARNRVVARLEENGLLTAEQAQLAVAASVPQQRSPAPFLAPHLSWRLHAARPDKELIATSLDSRLQEQLEALASQMQDRLGEDGRRTLAVLVADNRSRQVRAHIGSGRYASSRIDLTRARRSPGSALKPFIYGLAFEQGILHPETLILDRPERFGSYGPDNFDLSFHGWLPVREALQRSLNLPAVQVLERVGPERLLSRFAGLGVHLKSDGDPGLSLALGGAATTLQDLTALYAALADRGRYRPLSFSSGGTPVSEGRVLSPAAAWQVDDILRNMPMTASTRRGGIRYKTGTSYGFRDAWAIGYTPQHTVGVWIGRPDGGYGQRTTGSNAAVPVMLQVFAALPPDQPRNAEDNWERIPSGVLLARHSQLPRHLQYFTRSAEQQHGRPHIYFPVDGSTITFSANPVLTLKAHGGIPPFHWLINGQPLGREQQTATTFCALPGPGLTEIMLLDSQGQRDKVSVWAETDDELADHAAWNGSQGQD